MTSVRSPDNAEDRLLVIVQHRGGLEQFVARQQQSRRRLSRETGRLASQLLQLSQQVFPEQGSRHDQNLFDQGADPLLLVKLHEAIEAHFPGRVEITGLFDHPTVAALAAFIEAADA